ncbi:MAG: KH domain-containing protein [Actinomycetota bacterium]|nr:KH domain-containing protein [Actinomycetota bacterium]
MSDSPLTTDDDFDDYAEAGLEEPAGPDPNRVVGALPRQVLEYLARSIVDDPDSVLVEIEDGRRGLILRLHVAPGDMGRIIGRRGRVAQAIRTVVRAAGAREGVEAIVDIVD